MARDLSGCFEPANSAGMSKLGAADMIPIEWDNN